MSNWWDEGSAKKIKVDKDEQPAQFGLVKSIDDIEPLYSPEVAAKYLAVSIHTLPGLIRKGLLEPTKQGRNNYFTAQQIADCKRKRQQEWRRKKGQR
jgi:hypothetical protein